MSNEQFQAKLKIIFAMVTFGTIGIFVRNIELPSTAIALARGIIGTLFLLLVVFAKGKGLDKEAIKDFPKRVSSLHRTEQLIVDGFFVRNVNKQFDEVIVKSQPKGFDLTKDQRLKGLRGKEYIHSIGMWQDYCEFLKTFV